MHAFRWLPLAALLLTVPAQAQTPDLSNLSARPLGHQASYGLGYRDGKGFAETAERVGLSVDVYLAAFREAFEGRTQRLSDAEIRRVFAAINDSLMLATLTEQAATDSSAAVQLATIQRNTARSDSFLTANAARDSVTTLPSGLQYQVLTPGTGATPTATDGVTINYEGRLIDGTVFDSSYERGEPATFSLDGVIPGFSEALQQMQVGAKWRVYIPPHLAYGFQGAGESIGPAEALIFTLELLSVQAAPPAMPGMGG